MKKTKEQILRAIQDFVKEYGYPPTIREIGRRVGLKSTKAVKVHLDNLSRNGSINKVPSKARGLQIQPARIPIVGRVAAGPPELAFENIEGYFDPRHWQDCFMLKVKGDSMVNAHIYEGDMVVVDPTNEPQDGDIIVANLEGETTVKRLRKTNGSYVLKPENDAYLPIAGPFEIIGRVVGVIRKV